MLKFIDGFDHYNTSQLQAGRKWNVNIAGGYPQITSTNTRFGTGSAAVCNNTSAAFSKLFAAVSTVIVGFAFRIEYGPGSQDTVISFYDNNAQNTQVSVIIGTMGALIVKRGIHSGTVLGSCSIAMAQNVWYYVEIKLTINSTTGTVQIKINGQTALNLTGQNTQSTSNATVDTVTFNSDSPNGGAGFGPGGTVRYDDIYICDTTGPNNNNFIGDIKVASLFPTASGAFAQFTPSGAATNWQCVSENPADDDSSFVQTSTIGNEDTYVFQSISASATINGIQFDVQSRKADGGARTLTPVTRIGGTDYISGTINLTDTYLINTVILENNPSTSGSWVPSGINNAQFGYRLIG